MSYLIFGLGLLLAVCGAASISFGYGIINVERGWASVIGGAAALSGGIVTIALAAILHNLSGLRAFLKAKAQPVIVEAAQEIAPCVIDVPEAPSRVAASPVAPFDGGSADPGRSDSAGSAARPLSSSAAAVQRPEPSAPLAPASLADIRRVVAESMRRPAPERRPEIAAPEEAADAGAGGSQAPVAAPPVEGAPRRRPEPAIFSLPRAVGLKDLTSEQAGVARAAPEPPGVAPPNFPVRPAGGPVRPPQAPARPFAEKAAASLASGSEDRATVIGRYESEGTSYVMFADGSIDARSDLGAFRFSSMAELKAFMDAQARGQS